MSEDVPVDMQTATQVNTVAVGDLADDLDGTNSGTDRDWETDISNLLSY